MVFQISSSFKVLPSKKMTLVWFYWTFKNDFHPEPLSKREYEKKLGDKYVWWVLREVGKVASVFVRGEIICSDRDRVNMLFSLNLMLEICSLS